MASPLVTSAVNDALLAAAHAGAPTVECSLDLGLSKSTVRIESEVWVWEGQRFPYLQTCKDRTIYHWVDESFEAVARFRSSLIKLIPTEWGPPTFEIDGIKMLPTLKVSPYADAERKVALIQPRGKRVLDTCGGLGYFAAWCVRGQAAEVASYEKNADVIWLRSLNPWSPAIGAGLTLSEGDITEHIAARPRESVDAVLHDPPRFAIAGELYSQAFYEQLARVMRRKGRMFHYTGSPNKITSGRDVRGEVATRLRRAGFSAEFEGDGIVAVKQ